MELKQAIDKAVQDFGDEILKEKRLIGILADYNAFEDMPYAKNMLNSLYQGGEGEQLYTARTTNDNLLFDNVAYNIANKYGYAEDKMQQVVMAFAVQGYQPNEDTTTYPQDTTAPPQYTPPQPTPPHIQPQIEPPQPEPNQPWNRPTIPFSDPNDKESLSVQVRAIFGVVAFLYNFLAYAVGWGWLFLSVPLTGYYIVIVCGYAPKKVSLYLFIALTAIMATVALPLPWWTVLVACVLSVIWSVSISED